MKKKIKYLSYLEAKNYLKELNIKSKKEYQNFIKINDIDFLPNNARYTYLNDGWNGYGDFLNSSNISNSLKTFFEFDIARNIIRKLKIKNLEEYIVYTKSKDRNKNIPRNPHIYYKNNGWNGYGDWLGTYVIEKKQRIFVSYKECQEYAKNNNIYSSTLWYKLKKENIIPNNYPRNPNIVYKNEWISWNNFLNNNFLLYDEAKKYAHILNINSENEWRKYKKENIIPYNIPANPHDVYKNEWKGYHDFLGYNKKESSGEIKIKKYLSKNNIIFEQEKIFDSCKNILHLRFDFYLPLYNLCIEYDGIQHFEIVENFGGKKRFLETLKNDSLKNKWCLDNNINILRIPYQQYDIIENILEYELKSITSHTLL